jgi:hypothetical protein
MSRRPKSGANFQPKRIRKQIRKGLVRGYVGNKVADARVAARERAEFYRNLRLMKMQRRKIADQMRILATMIEGLRRDVTRVGDREPNVDMSLVEQAGALAKVADSSIAAAAEQFHSFSRKKIYFVQELAA